MRARAGAEPTEYRRDGQAGANGLHSVDGGSGPGGSSASSQDSGTGAGGTDRGDARDVTKAPWFNPVDSYSTSVSTVTLPGFSNECVDGVCPVPWAKAVDVLKESDFLTQDRNSNFPAENTVAPHPPVTQEDVVNHPSHYTDGGIECIEAIEAQLTPEEYRGYLRGNCAKYLWRCMLKGKPLEDLNKCRWYLDRLILTFED